MGYNGSNRKGYDRRYSGLSKSSMRSGSSVLFGKKGIVTGLLDIGGSIVKDITANNTASYGYSYMSQNIDESSKALKEETAQSNDFGLIIGFFITSVVLFFVAYITEWYNFFYILGYLSFCFSLLWVFGYVERAQSKGKKYLIIAIISVMLLCVMAAPFVLFFSDIWNITLVVILLPIILPILFLFGNN